MKFSKERLASLPILRRVAFAASSTERLPPMLNERIATTLLFHCLTRLVLGGVLTFSWATAHALDPKVKLADYNHTIWTAKDGAPAAISCIAQTRDGWLWLGTSSGLYRFDGVQFTKFAPSAGERLLGTPISSLYAADDGSLIIGYITGGLSVLRGNTLVHIAKQTDIAATYRTTIDADGSLWAATTKGLLHYLAGNWVRIGRERGLPVTLIDNVTLDRYSRLWVSVAGDDVYLLDRESGHFTPIGVPGGASSIIPAPGGQVWAFNNDVWHALPAPVRSQTHTLPLRLATDTGDGLVDRDGNVWLLRCPAGICRAVPETVRGLRSFNVRKLRKERLSEPWQVASLAPATLFEDREGNVWVGSPAGLERFRQNRLVQVPVPGGESQFYIVGDEQGAALIAGQETGRVFKAGESAFGRMARNRIYATASDGSLLWADRSGVYRKRQGKIIFTPLPNDADGQNGPPAPLRIVGNASEIWVLMAGRGVFRLRDGAWIHAGAYGLPASVTALSAALDGATWFGFIDGRVMRFLDGKLTTVVAPAGLPLGTIVQINTDHGVLISGEDGMAIVEHDVPRMIRTVTPAGLAGVSGMIRSANGDRWFNSRLGVAHVGATAWDEMLAHPDRPLALTVYDNLEGYPGSARAYSLFPTARADRDGRLWFASMSGVAYLDPASQVRNAVPPAVVVTPPALAGVRRAPGGSSELPAGTTQLRLDYTALAYTKPEAIRFRYRLDGVDDGWQDAGTRRTAFYTRLGPGAYRFRVMAVNEDGVPSTHEASTDFTIAPMVAQTGWFRALCALLAVVLLALAYRWRTRRLAQRLNERFQARLAERERISRALHDTLLQNMQALILRLHVAVKPMERSGEVRARIDAILDQADTVMTEAREEIKGLRGRTDGGRTDIGQALAAFGATLQEQFGAEFKLFVGGTARPLQDVAWQEIYYIGREALFNAYQHAHARKIEVELTYGNGEFGLVVRDDGRGIDDDIQQRGGRDGHWGLPGMKERAAALGGTLEWWSRAGLGTEVIARFPAARVYAPEEQQRWRRLRALLGRTGP